MLDLFFQVLILSSHFSLVFFRVGSWSASAALVLDTRAGFLFHPVTAFTHMDSHS